MAEVFKLVSGGEDIKIWESPSLRLTQTLKLHSQSVSSLVWSPNNHLLASTAPGDQVVVTSLKGATPNSVDLPGCEDDTCLAFNSTSRHLLVGGKSQVLNLWDLKTRTIKKKIKNHKEPINCVTFNWNDTNIASGTSGGDIFVHNVSTTLTSAPLRLPKTQTIHALHYSRFKKALLGSVSDDGAMNVWDTNTKKIVASFPDQHRAPAMDICFSPMNDMLMASAGLDKKIIFYDILGKKVIKEMAADSPLTSIAFMQDGAAFAVGSTRGKIYVYDLRSGSTPLHTTAAHKSAIHCLSYQLSPKGNTSSSSTLAEKFTSRSASDPSKGGAGGGSGGEGGLRNGVKNNDDDGAIFSPLREGLSSNNTLEKAAKENEGGYEAMGGSSKRTDSITVSGIFSPINSTTQLSQHPTTKPPDAFVTDPPTTHDLNGYTTVLPATKDDLQLPSMKQPSSLTTSTPRIQNPSRASSDTGNGTTGTLTSNKNQAFFTPPLSTVKPSATGNSRTKTTSTYPVVPSLSQMPVETQQENNDETLQQAQRVSSNSSLAATDKKSLSNVADIQAATDGFIQPTSTVNHGENTAGFQPFQMQFMKNLIDDALDDFRVNCHRDIVNLQVEMLRQFQIQQNEMKALMQQYSLNDALVEENKRLKEENKKLKATH